MKEHKGKIDLGLAQKFMGDHFDSFSKDTQPNERTLCGHIDLSPRGSMPWQEPYGIAGTVANQAADSALAARMAITASMGHSCGIDFKAAPHLKAHPEFEWESGLLRDMNSHPWAEFRAAR